MPAYKTIQVTPKEYEMLMKLHRYLIKLGTKSIEDKIGDEKFSVDKLLHEMERNTLAKGAVAGIAIAMALYILKEGEGEVT